MLAYELRRCDKMIYNFDELTFQVLSIARFKHKNGFVSVNSRPYAALSFRESGVGRFEIDGERIVTEPGDVLFIPADTEYKVEYSSSESIVVHMRDCNYHEAENICMQGQTVLGALFQGLLAEWDEGHSVNKAKSVIYEIFENMVHFKKMDIPNPSALRCMQYIESHFSDPALDIAAVCQANFISQSSLQRAFKEYLGVSPKQYLIKLRMNKALELLMQNELLVKEVAEACGFSDEKFFSRSFKQKYGYPPSRIYKHITV